jgi:SAM-dependent methyltransferase
MGDQPTFDAYYYAHSCGRPYARDAEWLRFFGTVADRIAADVTVPSFAGVTEGQRVLDAGCAMGLLVEALVERGIDAHGIDISEYAIAQAAPAIRDRLRVGSLTTPLDGRYDLIVCIEVLEHMPPADARVALANLCAHADDIIFSSSPTDFGETTHVNVQPPEAWAEAFAREGLLRDLDYDASYITPWAVRYRRRSEPIPRVVREYERVTARLMIERNELRQQVLQFDRQVQKEADDAPRLRVELARVNEELLAAQRRIAALDDTVRHMEASAFWRLRNVWRAIRGLGGGTR